MMTEFETYNYLVNYLIEGGYAYSEGAADKIILNMSEAWYGSIMEEVYLEEGIRDVLPSWLGGKNEQERSDDRYAAQLRRTRARENEQTRRGQAFTTPKGARYTRPTPNTTRREGQRAVQGGRPVTWTVDDKGKGSWAQTSPMGSGDKRSWQSIGATKFDDPTPTKTEPPTKPAPAAPRPTRPVPVARPRTFTEPKEPVTSGQAISMGSKEASGPKSSDSTWVDPKASETQKKTHIGRHLTLAQHRAAVAQRKAAEQGSSSSNPTSVTSSYQPEGETIEERTRYAKETGKDFQTGKESKKGGDEPPAAMKHLQKKFRDTGGMMSSRKNPIQPQGKKKEKGKKGYEGVTPVDKIKGKLAQKRAPKPDIGSRYD